MKYYHFQFWTPHFCFSLVLPFDYMTNYVFNRGCLGSDRMLVGFTTTYAITTDAVSSNLNQGEVYNII